MSKNNFIKTILSSALMAAIYIIPANAQNASGGGPAVGKWRSFLPYSEVTSIATDATTFFCGTHSAFFTYNRTDGSLTGYSKETGMHDIGITNVAYDPLTGKTIIAYTNSNIDLFKDGGFSNIPAIKISQQSGDKSIHDITIHDGAAYVSSGIGLSIINLNKEEVKETVFFYDSTLSAAVYATTFDDTYVYAATSVGLFRITINNAFIQNYLIWDKLDSKVYNYLTSSNNNVYAAVSDSLFSVPATGAPVFKEKMGYTIQHLDPENNGTGVWIAAADTANNSGYGILRKTDGSRSDSFFTVSPTQILQLGNGDVWYGDDADYRFTNYHGLRKKTSVNQSEVYFPEGPVTATAFAVTANNGDMWLAHGSKNESWGRMGNRANFSHFVENKWSNVNYINENPWFQDFIRINKDQNSGNLYVISYSGGLYERHPDGTVATYTGNQYFSGFQGGDSVMLVSGMSLDDQGNLWMSNYGGTTELVVKTYDGLWYKMHPVDGNSGHTAADVIVDDYGQKWFIAVANGGLVVYNDNGTIDNTSDDAYRIYKMGEGAGNLPDNNTLSLVKDKDGSIWVGTTNGIGIIGCGDQALDPSACQAELRAYKDDQFAGYLFQGQSVTAMAVDGANRKWIGTPNGAWLLSPDGETIISKFTVDNSPLLDNNIEHIDIDPVTGDVYFCTGKGLISYRGTATEGGTANEDKLYIYPNPVPTNYSGMIAIRGFAANSDVRITDIAGQLVYRTKANGGEAVWNGMDYTGHKAQSGVYLVFGVNKDGTQKITGKFILHR